MKVDIDIKLLESICKALSDYDDACQRDSYYGISPLLRQVREILNAAKKAGF